MELEELYFEGTLRVSLHNFVTVLPCFSRVRHRAMWLFGAAVHVSHAPSLRLGACQPYQMSAAFVEPPQLDFKLQVMHLPVTSIPGVHSLTRYFLQQALEANVRGSFQRARGFGLLNVPVSLFLLLFLFSWHLLSSTFSFFFLFLFFSFSPPHDRPANLTDASPPQQLCI